MEATTATSTSTSVRYAPEDPTLPKPWKGLVDGKTGYLYFWNPETNVTQYERPVTSSNASSAATDKSLSSSDQKSLVHCSNYDEEDKYNQGSNHGAAKVASGLGANQAAKSRSDYSLSDPDVTKSAARGPSASKFAEAGLSGEAYCRRHEITVTCLYGGAPKGKIVVTQRIYIVGPSASILYQKPLGDIFWTISLFHVLLLIKC